MHQRMLEVCHEFEAMDQKERTRSCSLPIPDLNILMAGATTPTPASGIPSGTGFRSPGANSSYLSNVLQLHLFTISLEMQNSSPFFVVRSLNNQQDLMRDDK